MELNQITQMTDQWVTDNLLPNTHLPLFISDTNNVVHAKPRKANGKYYLPLSTGVQTLLLEIRDTLKRSHTNGQSMEGMLYCLYTINNNITPVPLYFGISHYHSNNGKVNTLWRNGYRYARFANATGSHIWNLSSLTCSGFQDKECHAYANWVHRLFESPFTHNRPRLNSIVYFWGTAWGPDSQSIVKTLGHTPLFVEETILIWLFCRRLPLSLLNSETSLHYFS